VEHAARSRGGAAVLVAAWAVLLGACAHGPAEELAKPPKLEIPGKSKCKAGETPTHPLVVEWPAVDRASLEARIAHGLVVVRARGCDIEVLRGCWVAAQYDYVGLTRKNDRVRIRSVDELYASLPLGAAGLEGKLARYKGLDVEIALVGMFEAPFGGTSRGQLEGDCAEATHVITGAQVGAFQFYAGGAGELKAGVKVGGAGAGAGTAAARETLSADGDPARCDASTTADAHPPEGCGAIIRIELTPLAPAPPPAPAEPAIDPREVPAPRSPAPVVPEVAIEQKHEDDEAALCRRSCERDMQCKAEAQGTAEPEGKGREAFLRMCARTCEFMVNDFTRPQLRACLEHPDCAAFAACMAPDGEAEADPFGADDTGGF